MFYKKERQVWMDLVKEMKEEQAKERERLLDRLQHPEQTYSGQQLVLGEKIVHDPPKDVEELAWVGQEVPEFVKVGTQANGEVELDPELARIQQIAKATSG